MLTSLADKRCRGVSPRAARVSRRCRRGAPRGGVRARGGLVRRRRASSTTRRAKRLLERLAVRSARAARRRRSRLRDRARRPSARRTVPRGARARGRSEPRHAAGCGGAERGARRGDADRGDAERLPLRDGVAPSSCSRTSCYRGPAGPAVFAEAARVLEGGRPAVVRDARARFVAGAQASLGARRPTRSTSTLHSTCTISATLPSRPGSTTP